MDGFVRAKQAAELLGISTTTLYAWLGLSDRGLLVIQEASVTVDYLQSGPHGQGTIWISRTEINRLRELMRVRPNCLPLRSCPKPKPESKYQHITAQLGRPDD